jgi:hypothetical protein
MEKQVFIGQPIAAGYDDDALHTKNPFYLGADRIPRAASLVGMEKFFTKRFSGKKYAAQPSRSCANKGILGSGPVILSGANNMRPTICNLL